MLARRLAGRLALALATCATCLTFVSAALGSGDSVAVTAVAPGSPLSNSPPGFFITVSGFNTKSYTAFAIYQAPSYAFSCARTVIAERLRRKSGHAFFLGNFNVRSYDKTYKFRMGFIAPKTGKQKKICIYLFSWGTSNTAARTTFIYDLRPFSFKNT